MGLLAVLLHEENLLFSEDHLQDIRKQSARMNHRGKGIFHHEREIVLLQHFHDETHRKPYHFSNGRYILAFDGIVTNLSQLHSLLSTEGFSFTDNTVEEIIANLYLYKKTKSFSLLEGSFVILIWDKRDKVLLGARDRFGVKQLYYTESAVEVMLSSEKKSLLFPQYEEHMDDYAFHHYLDYGYIPEPHSITKGIKQVKRGHYFIKKINEPIHFIRYDHCSFPKNRVGKGEYLTEGADRLYEAVSTRLNIRQKNSLLFRNSLSTLALGHVAKQYDENLTLLSIYNPKGRATAETIAKELEINHLFISVTSSQFMEKLPKIIWLLDDPFANVEIVTNYFIGKFSNEQGHRGLMSDLGSEAVLGNYPVRNNVISKIETLLPSLLRKGNESPIDTAPLFSKTFKQKLLGRIVTVNHDQKRFIQEVQNEDSLIQRQYVDLNSDLPSNKIRIMEKLMAASNVTLLLPFLDEALFETMRYKSFDEKRKNAFLLSILSERFSPQRIRSFMQEGDHESSLPIEQWLRTDCYEWAKNLMKASNIDYILSKEKALKMLEEFKENEREPLEPLWTVFVFILWHLVYVDDFFSFRESKGSPIVTVK